MSLDRSDEVLRTLSENQAVQLHSSDIKNDKDWNYSSTKVLSPKNESYKCSNYSDEFACTSKIPLVRKQSTDDKIYSSEKSKSFVCHCKEFHPLIDRTHNCLHCYSSTNKASLSTSSKTHESITKQIQNHRTESEFKTTSGVTHQERTSHVARDDFLSASKLPDLQLEETVCPTEKTYSNPSLITKRTDSIQPNQMKTKLRSMWNNVKYGWRVKREVSLKVDSAVWLLGRCYHNKLNESSTLSQDVTKQLKLDLLSKIWLTYRINFQRIPGTEFVSDSGWGCMLRCGQMMMAQALVCHFLNRDWRIASDQPKETKQLYTMILRLFADSLSDSSPFSLHHLVSFGINYGRKVGDWYGPTHVAQVLRDALYVGQQKHLQLRDLCMHVALDGIVFKEDVEDLCCRSVKQNCQKSNDKKSIKSTKGSNENRNPMEIENLHSDETHRMSDYEDSCPSYSQFGPPSFNTSQNGWKSLILFVSVRLGNDRINPFYIPCLKSLLAYEHCIGIIGGRPKHALYFIGWQDDKLIHMDPHTCQPAVDVEKEEFNEKSFHSSSIRTMSFSEMDPSCAIGFYFRFEEEFRHFIEKFSEITAPMKKNLDYPVFALAEGRRSDIEETDFCNAHTRYSFSNTSNASTKEEDDYILL